MQEVAENRQNKRIFQAIMYADAVGYTRLTQLHASETHQSLCECRKLFGECISEFDGVLFQVVADNVMARFDSAHNALLYGLAMQERFKKYNQNCDESKRLEFRVGISAGDVYYQSNHIFGDELNVAERVQRLAYKGGVCVSESAYQLLKEYRDEYAFEYLGEYQLKLDENIVKAYRVARRSQSSIMLASDRQEPSKLSKSHYSNSIAVLPFRSTSDDPMFETLGEGFAEDLINGLSCFREFYVISRNSSFLFRKNEPVMWDIARTLGVRYILDGSIRNSDNRMRISVHLWDLEDHRNVWGDSFDCDLSLKHIFDIQDEISRMIIELISVQLRQMSREYLRKYEPDSLHAYMHVLQGEHIHLKYNKADNILARQLYETAINIDADYARAITGLSRTYNDDWRFRWSDSPNDSMDKALQLAQKGLESDPLDARAHAEMGLVQLYRGCLDESIAAYEKARMINPNDADILADMGDAVAYNGNPKEAVVMIHDAMRRNPFYPDRYLWHLGGAYYALRQYEETIRTMRKMSNAGQTHRLLAASYAQLNDKCNAKKHAELLSKAQPNFDPDEWADKQPERDDAEKEHLKEGLMKAWRLIQ